MKKSRVWQAIVPGTQNKPQDTLQIRKTPWHGVTKQPPALSRMKKIKGLAGNCSRHTNQATRHPSNQENTLSRRDETASCRPSARAKRLKKSRVWQAIIPGTQNRPQDTLQIRKTPWHGATKRSRHTKQATRHPSNQENTWHGVTKQPPAKRRS